MRVIDSCAKCLYDRQLARANKCEDTVKRNQYIQYVKEVLDNRAEDDCAPYLVSLFNAYFEKLFGEILSYEDIRKEYNDLVLSMEVDIEQKILSVSTDEKKRLAEAICYSRVGNYIDFGAMNNVDKNTFLKLFDGVSLSDKDQTYFEQFYEECSNAKRLLLIADNCGEIVLDKILIRRLKKSFPKLTITVLVRGQEVLNDATMDDASYVGIDREATVIPNGSAVAGTIYHLISEDAKKAIDEADVILAKGQGNYESMSGQGRHIYYSFLCKCELFTTRFGVPKLTGMFVSE